MVGLPGFEPDSREPRPTSLDQASRQPRVVSSQTLASLFKNFVLGPTHIMLAHCHPVMKGSRIIINRTRTKAAVTAVVIAVTSFSCSFLWIILFNAILNIRPPSKG